MAVKLMKFSRNFSHAAALRASLAEPLNNNVKVHKTGSDEFWKKIFLFVCCPILTVLGINAWLEEEPKRPEFVKYPHLRIRNCKFPWGDGDKSLFHNPYRNALPNGYETDEKHH